MEIPIISNSTAANAAQPSGESGCLTLLYVSGERLSLPNILSHVILDDPLFIWRLYHSNIRSTTQTTYTY